MAVVLARSYGFRDSLGTEVIPIGLTSRKKLGLVHKKLLYSQFTEIDHAEVFDLKRNRPEIFIPIADLPTSVTQEAVIRWIYRKELTSGPNDPPLSVMSLIILYKFCHKYGGVFKLRNAIMDILQDNFVNGNNKCDLRDVKSFFTNCRDLYHTPMAKFWYAVLSCSIKDDDKKPRTGSASLGATCIFLMGDFVFLDAYANFQLEMAKSGKKLLHPMLRGTSCFGVCYFHEHDGEEYDDEDDEDAEVVCNSTQNY